MFRFGKVLALAAAIAVVAPVCGAMVTLLCQEPCCCPQMKVSSCDTGECMTSVPVVLATPAGLVAKNPVAAGLLVGPVSDSMPAETIHHARSKEELTGHSPPDLYLQNCLLLI